MIDMLQLWMKDHALIVWVVGIVLGWFIPDPWKWVMNNVDKAVLFLIAASRARLHKSGATDEQILAWEKKLNAVIERVDKKMDEDIAEAEKKLKVDAPAPAHVPEPAAAEPAAPKPGSAT